MRYPNLNVDLFALSKARSNLSGYHLDAAGNVYSTQQQSTPKKMMGSVQYGRSSVRTYTLNRSTYTSAQLLNIAKAHPDFVRETSPALAVAATPVAVAGSKRNHAATVADGLKVKGVVIAQVASHNGQEFLLFGSKPAIHTTEASYKDEMTRLATGKPGTKFVALKVVATVVSGGVSWE